METQRAIENLLRQFTEELMKVFSESMLQAMMQVTGVRTLQPFGGAPATAPRHPRGPSKAVVKAKPARPAKETTPVASKKKHTKDKSSSADVARLAEDILVVLRRADRNLSSREIMAELHLSSLEAGRFGYALNKLKTDGRVTRHGDRRLARYGLGGAEIPDSLSEDSSDDV